MTNKLIFVTLLVLFSNSICENDEDNESDEIFVPTKEWKTIKEGQKVPSGLHYRINLSTGKKEAKINKEEEPDVTKSFSMTSSDKAESVLKETDTKHQKKDSPKKFRTLEEIRKDLSDIEVTPKSDVEILQELFVKFKKENQKKPVSDKVIVNILRDLTYLGHQIDNGNEFVKMDGFKTIIYNKLNSTNVIIKQETLKLFSTLAQNNPHVKVHILETGGITILLRVLNLDEHLYVKSSAVTALSCTLRTFPYAQNKFIESGGLTIFTSLFKSTSMKLKLKLVTLLNDFVVERQKDIVNFENHKYIDIEKKLYELGWCKYLNELLHDIANVDLHDYDSVEKTIIAMKSMQKICNALYDRELLSKLFQIYNKLLQDEDDTDDYFKYLSTLIEALLQENEDNYRKEEL